jgi:hypothetical protein
MAWSPRTPLEQGLARTIAYFEQLLRDQELRALAINGALG